jgi:hypothetical protein
MVVSIHTCIARNTTHLVSLIMKNDGLALSKLPRCNWFPKAPKAQTDLKQTWPEYWLPCISHVCHCFLMCFCKPRSKLSKLCGHTRAWQWNDWQKNLELKLYYYWRITLSLFPDICRYTFETNGCSNHPNTAGKHFLEGFWP